MGNYSHQFSAIFKKQRYFKYINDFLVRIFWRNFLTKKIVFSSKNLNIGQKLKFSSKIEVLVKNRNFGQKSKFSSNIDGQMRKFPKNGNFGQKSKFSSKKVLVKNRSFGQRSKLSSKEFLP